MMDSKEIKIMNFKLRMAFIDSKIENLNEEKANILLQLLKEEKKESILFKGFITNKIMDSCKRFDIFGVS